MDRLNTVQPNKNTSNLSFAIIGLSRLGLFTATRLLKVGYKVTCYDRSGYQLSRVLQGNVLEDDKKTSAFIRRQVSEGNLVLTESFDSALKVSNIVVICERAPTNDRKIVQIRRLYELADLTGKNMRRGLVIVLQTLAPLGTARIFAKKCEELSGLTCGKDFDLVYAPSPLVGSENFENDLIRIMAGSRTEAVSIISGAFEAAGLGKSVLASSFEAAEISIMRIHVELCLKQALRAELSALCEKMDVKLDETETLLAKIHVNEKTMEPALFARNSAATATKLLEAGRMKRVNLPISRRARDVCWGLPQYIAKAIIRSLKSREPKPKSLTVIGSFREFDSVEKSSHPELDVIAALNRVKLKVKMSRVGETAGGRTELGIYLQPFEKALKDSRNVAVLSSKTEDIRRIYDFNGVCFLDLYT